LAAAKEPPVRTRRQDEADAVRAYQAGDYATAGRLWRRIAEAGGARAEYHLGTMCYEGRLGPPDLAAAYAWVSRAVAGGETRAAGFLAQITSEMTPGQLEEARRRAEAEGRSVVVVGSVCGTPADPQGLERQEARLRAAGVLLARTNAAAARAAAQVVGGAR
jgi:TPR repeat protein